MTQPVRRFKRGGSSCGTRNEAHERPVSRPDNGNGGEIRNRPGKEQRLQHWLARTRLESRDRPWLLFLWVSVIRLLEKGVALLFSPKQIRSTSRTGRRPGRWSPPRTADVEQQQQVGEFWGGGGRGIR